MSDDETHHPGASAAPVPPEWMQSVQDVGQTRECPDCGVSVTWTVPANAQGVGAWMERDTGGWPNVEHCHCAGTDRPSCAALCGYAAPWDHAAAS